MVIQGSNSMDTVSLVGKGPQWVSYGSRHFKTKLTDYFFSLYMQYRSRRQNSKVHSQVSRETHTVEDPQQGRIPAAHTPWGILSWSRKSPKLCSTLWTEVLFNFPLWSHFSPLGERDLISHLFHEYTWSRCWRETSFVSQGVGAAYRLLLESWRTSAGPELQIIKDLFNLNL